MCSKSYNIFWILIKFVSFQANYHKNIFLMYIYSTLVPIEIIFNSIEVACRLFLFFLIFNILESLCFVLCFFLEIHIDAILVPTIFLREFSSGDVEVKAHFVVNLLTTYEPNLSKKEFSNYYTKCSISSLTTNSKTLYSSKWNSLKE